MKESNLPFLSESIGDFAQKAAMENKPQLAFDWDKAAEIIKENFTTHPDLVAEAGLQGDWAYTGGVIFRDGMPNSETYTYLSSNWAKPTLILSWGGEERLEVECSVIESDRFQSHTKWDKKSLSILGINQL